MIVELIEGVLSRQWLFSSSGSFGGGSLGGGSLGGGEALRNFLFLALTGGQDLPCFRR